MAPTAALNSAPDYRFFSDVADLGKDWTNVRKGASFSDQEACSITGPAGLLTMHVRTVWR